MKNKFIGFNFRQIQEIVDYAYKTGSAILSVDSAKVFYSLVYNLMLMTLTHFGFNDSFTRGFKTLLRVQTCVMNNGLMYGRFKN